MAKTPIIDPRLLALARQADALSRRYPPGTPVRYWPGSKEGPGRRSRLSQRYQVLSTHEIVTHVEDHKGCLPVSHVEPLEEAKENTCS